MFNQQVKRVKLNYKFKSWKVLQISSCRKYITMIVCDNVGAMVSKKKGEWEFASLSYKFAFIIIWTEIWNVYIWASEFINLPWNLLAVPKTLFSSDFLFVSPNFSKLYVKFTKSRKKTDLDTTSVIGPIKD